MASEKSKERSKELREKTVETILSLMEKDGLRWIQGFDPNMFLARNDCTPTTYRGLNRWHLAAAMLIRHYADPRFCTFNQAKAKGWKVKKGSKASLVEFYKEMPYVVESAVDIRFLKKREVDEMRANGDEPGWMLCLAGCSAVFNYQDIEGPEPYLPPAPPSGFDGIIDALIASSRCPIHDAGVKAACYVPEEDEIVLPPRAAYDDAARYAATLVHEMAHSTSVPLGRKLSGLPFTSEYAVEELRAEMASVFVCAELGIPLDATIMESHAAYVRHWLEAAKEDGTVMTAAIQDAQKIADYILGAYRTQSQG